MVRKAGAPLARILALCLAAVVLGGCAGVEDKQGVADTITIERVNSAHAEIKYVQVRDRDGRLEVWGRIKKRFAGRSPIQGHLRIEAFDGDGRLLAETTASYRRLNPKMGLSEFRQPLAVASDQVRVVRITHHLAHDAAES